MERDRNRDAIRRRSSSSSNSNLILSNRKGHKMSVKHRYEKSSGLDPAAGGFVVSGAKSALGSSKTAQERDSAWLEKEIHKVQREKERLDRERLKYAAKEEKCKFSHELNMIDSKKNIERVKQLSSTIDKNGKTIIVGDIVRVELKIKTNSPKPHSQTLT